MNPTLTSLNITRERVAEIARRFLPLHPEAPPERDAGTWKACRPNEITLKRWIAEEAERVGMTFRALQGRIYRGQYPRPVTRRQNARLLYVVAGDVPCGTKGVS